jgi:hypothetical protein
VKRLLSRLAAAALLAAAVPSLAAAPGRPSGMQVYRVCKTDMKAFCPHMGAGSKAQKACMKTHYDELSAPCRDIIDRYEAKTGEKPANSGA